MNKTVLLISVLLFSLSSCDNYSSPVTIKPEVIAQMNKEIVLAQAKVSDWTISPEKIATHFYPNEFSQGGSTKYEVTKKGISNSTCTVTILQEGLFDDELEGERQVIYFKKIKDTWTIKSIKASVKRRL